MTYYTQLARLRLAHTYFETGETEDFRIEPLGPTAGLLRRERLLLKTGAAGLRIFYSSNEKPVANGPPPDPILPLEPRLDLYFGLRLTNPAFHAYTALPALLEEVGRSTVHFFETPDDLPEAGAPVVLEQATVRLAAGSIGLDFAAREQSALIALDTLDGARVVQSFVPVLRKEPTDALGQVLHNLDVRGLPPGLYTLHYRDEAGEKEAAYFIGAGGGGWFGLVHLRLDTADLAALRDLRPFEVRFQARQDTWTYRLLVGKPHLDTALLIHHRAAGNGGDGNGNGNGNVEVIQFKAPELVSESDLEKTLSFASAQPVSYRQRPRKGLDLVKADDTSNSLIADLPNPSPFRLRPEVFLKLKRREQETE